MQKRGTKKLFSEGDICPCGKRVERCGVRWLCPDPVGHAEWEECQEAAAAQRSGSKETPDQVLQSA